jgi:protein-S-isoprenylcysteine O-methyltransferase Ste14
VLMLFRHLLSIALLPFTVAVLVPYWLLRGKPLTIRLGSTPLQLLEQAAGIFLIVIGLILFVTSLRRFATEGKGTLAPWDPPRELVVCGPYRYVRNPMISGVVLVLFGEGLVLFSAPVLGWAVTFLAINFVYIPLLEEPMLSARFGESYEEYRRNVPRLIPRVTPWVGNNQL